jgi:putative nucleotidyltransferase with HDIG domain
MTAESTKETVLFVDDEESILDIARTYFSDHGYRVLTAANGREAVEILWNNRIDCCFTDINMPEMDGLEFAEYVRKYDNTLPVVVMTGYPSLDNSIQTLKNGVVDFLIKPINLSQMELCVQRVLRERRLFIDNILLSKEVEGKRQLEKLNTELLAKNDDLNVINRIMSDFSDLHESADVFNQLVDSAVQLVKADAACFYLLNESVDEIVPIAISKSDQCTIEDTLPEDPKKNHASRNLSFAEDAKIRSLAFDVVHDDQPLLIVENNGAKCLPDEIKSFMMTPLKIRNKLLGVLGALVLGDGRRFSEKNLYYLSFMANKAASAMESLALYENIYSNLLATLYAFVRAIEARDPYTRQHSSRVTQLALAIARTMDLSSEEQEILNVAGHLHDIGKIGIRDEILLKPGRLSPEEFKVIKQHPVIGADIMDHMGLWHREKQIVRCHHERFDGTGYPDRLKGEEIPLLARILSIADVYDAIASDRAYRQRMEESKILSIMYDGAGTQFDPDIVDVFRGMYESGEISHVMAQAD